ncbi:uncharacterized protein SOCEGT47_063640 [Sorangium cellulosum]|uniref:HNH nuclease domain-containing protein n=1 Tax=Sorangium cellulosum TaxID=56 RepID=A0A4V0NED7_SORCE|nr:hypothetical protein [Sorangium cellulosum]AUX25812.1 uncharacterized protein SOCEGT47_063640 [Sorangium cellulosum]
MIRIVLAAEPPSFDERVRERGKDAITRLLGKPVNGKGGRKPKKTYVREEDIPSKRFPALWIEPRRADGKSTLDDMMELYGQQCAYLAMHIEKATGSPTVDHFIPKSTNWRLVYEWSNYRLSAACVNAAKGVLDVVDPFEVHAGWFELNLATLHVQRGRGAPSAQHTKIDNTLPLLNLRECRQQREEYVTRYQLGPGNKGIDLAYLAHRAPFIASELRRQGKLVRGDI